MRRSKNIRSHPKQTKTYGEDGITFCEGQPINSECIYK
jgi:hypothetical protein